MKYNISFVSFFLLRFYTATNEFCYTIKKNQGRAEGCSKLKSPETRQVHERLVSTLEHLQVPKWDRTRGPEE